VRGIGKSFEGLGKTVDQQLREVKPQDVSSVHAKEYKRTKVYFEAGRRDTPIYRLENLEVGDRIKGPAILADGTQTIVVTPSATALIIETHVVISIGEHETKDTQVDFILDHDEDTN
jgi:5-oxoprolinase (ATP-hydrolysing)